MNDDDKVNAEEIGSEEGESVIDLHTPVVSDDEPVDAALAEVVAEITTKKADMVLVRRTGGRCAIAGIGEFETGDEKRIPRRVAISLGRGFELEG